MLGRKSDYVKSQAKSIWNSNKQTVVYIIFYKQLQMTKEKIRIFYFSVTQRMAQLVCCYLSKFLHGL